jgi:hypothetical protein
MDIRIQNSGTSKVIGLTATLSSTSSYITFTKASYTYGDIPAGFYDTCYYSSANSSSTLYMSPSSFYFAFSIVSGTPTGTIIPIAITFSDTQGNTWYDSFSITL